MMSRRILSPVRLPFRHIRGGGECAQQDSNLRGCPPEFEAGVSADSTMRALLLGIPGEDSNLGHPGQSRMFCR